jgi:hypothetical protein
MAQAHVGDIVTYDDGSEANIIDRAGFAAAWEDKPFAPVASRLSNGDTITETLEDRLGITVRSDKPVPACSIQPMSCLWPNRSTRNRTIVKDG